MEIRKLTIADYDKIIALWTKAQLPIRPKGRDTKEALATQIKANPDFFLGAFANGSLVGVVIASSDARKGWINRLAVDPERRHRGIAKALIRECEKILRKNGVTIFAALIEDHNVASKKLFKKCGYVEHHDLIYFSKRDSSDV